jgi:hypothetical protein
MYKKYLHRLLDMIEMVDGVPVTELEATYEPMEQRSVEIAKIELSFDYLLEAIDDESDVPNEVNLWTSLLNCVFEPPFPQAERVANELYQIVQNEREMKIVTLYLVSMYRLKRDHSAHFPGVMKRQLNAYIYNQLLKYCGVEKG